MSFFSNRRQAEDDRDKPDNGETFSNRPLYQPIGFETVLGASNIMEGKLVSRGNVRLDGEFTGTLDITGNVLVGETGKINADIDARNISIAGAVRGNITGNKVQLLRTGRIWGDITARALTMEEGAFLDGKITMTGQKSDAQSAAPAEALDDTQPAEPDPQPTAPDPSADDTPAEAPDDNDPIT